MINASRFDILAVYAALLEKDGSLAKYYIGSGTNLSKGMYRRILQYRDI